MQNGAQAHRNKLLTKQLKKKRNITVLECAINSLDLNPIENEWNVTKLVQKAQPSNINELKDTLKHLWVTMDIEHF